MIKVAILGSTGMLGSALTRYLGNEAIDICEFNRSGTSITKNNDAKKFDVTTDANLFRDLENTVLTDELIGMIVQSAFSFALQFAGIDAEDLNDEDEIDAKIKAYIQDNGTLIEFEGGIIVSSF